MILLDWTRLGLNFCLAGAVADKSGWRIVRPMQARSRAERIRKFGWPAHALRGHGRWEIFQLVEVEPAEPEPPHLEDLWVRGLRATGRSASTDQRRAILQATLLKDGEPLFGVPLTATRAAGFLPSGTGTRSLVTVIVAASRLQFAGSWRQEIHADLRVQVPVPELGTPWLPVKDFALLERTKPADYRDLDGHVAALSVAVRAMGERVALRLGLSRPFEAGDAKGPPVCWLMADGFFSLTDPQP
jgi:hypothetical protein